MPSVYFKISVLDKVPEHCLHSIPFRGLLNSMKICYVLSPVLLLLFLIFVCIENYNVQIIV